MLSRVALGSALAVILASGCGHKAKDTSAPVGGDDGQVQCEPGRCLEDISKLVSEHRDESRKCYDEGKKRDPNLAGGFIVINFAIDADGNVADTSQGMQDAQIMEPGTVDCVSQVIKGVHFAKSAKGKTTRAYHRFEFGK
jgi:hypothetical protein